MDDFEDEDVGYSSSQEFSFTFPQERFVVTYVSETNDALHYTRVTKFISNVADAGSLISELQSKGVDTVEMYKLEPYDLSKALAVYEKKVRRAKRRENKKEDK